MSRQDVKQLRDRNPEKRRIAIKNVARDKDRNALKQLAFMAGDDPDPTIRELARKAGVYIRQQIGELPPPEKNGKAARIAVDPRNEQAAQREMSSAMSFQMNGDDLKATKALQKAISLNPNLRQDSYFVSLCEAISEEEGEAAVAEVLNGSGSKEKSRGLGGLFGGRK